MKPFAVLKFGGAQARSDRLGDWLDAITAQAGRIVVVPGGGVFADLVRTTQTEIGFDDEAAHEMAMMAMRQFARALSGLRPAFEVVNSRAEILDALERRRVPLWSPERMALAAKLPASWRLTSDSLAAWLAGELGAERLVLVKYGAAASASELAQRGVVDPLFPAYLAEARVRAFLAPPGEPERLAEGLDGQGLAEIGVDA